MSYAGNPRAPKPDYDNLQQEPTGAVAKDSLAAESLRAGEGFSLNENAEALGVRGANSTLNTTDTSGATALHAARDGATRAKEDFQALGSDERGHTGVKYPDAEAGDYAAPSGYSDPTTRSSTQGGYSGATGDSFAPGAVDTGDLGPDSNIRSGSEAVQRPTTYASDDTNEPIATGRAGEAFGKATRPSGTMATTAGIAPNYAGTVSGAIRPEGELQPKGKNLVEGGIPETKTFTGNVGGVHDPGRLAEQDFQKTDAGSLVSAGGLKYSGSGQDSNTGGAFDVLSSERAPDRSS